MGYISKQLAKRKHLLCSGAWATELVRRGHPHARCIEAWNTEKPEVVRDLCDDYAAVPVDMLGTNTFGANRLQLEMHSLADYTASINYAGAMLSRNAVRGGAVVCGLIGPVSASMPKWDEEALADAYRQQANALHTGGADVLWLETMQSMREAALAVTVLKETTPCDVICTFSLLEGDLGYSTYCGMFAHEALREVAKAKPDALGFNCGNGPEECVKLRAVARDAGVDHLPLAFKPNAGLPNLGGEYPHTPEIFAVQMGVALKNGFKIIGGCCGAGVGHIRALREMYAE